MVRLAQVGEEAALGVVAAVDLIKKVDPLDADVVNLGAHHVWNILKLLKAKFTAGIKSKLGALLLKDKFRELKSEFDYSEYGGAPILGIKGAVVKIHGSSNANAVMNAIFKGIPYVENKVVQIIQNSVEEIEEILISE